MEFIEIVLMFGGMGLGFAALYEIALWFSPEERDFRKSKKAKQVKAQKFITLPTVIKLKTGQKVSWRKHGEEPVDEKDVHREWTFFTLVCLVDD